MGGLDQTMRSSLSGNNLIPRFLVCWKLICEKGSAEALAKAIGDLLSDRERLAKCAEGGRTAVEATFNIQQMAEVYLERLAKLG